MSRFLNSLPLLFAAALLSIFASSCGSSSQSQVRLVHAISDGPALDVDISTTKVFTNIAFTGIQPTPPAYTKNKTGSVTLEALHTGTTTAYIANTNGSLSGSSQYTIMMTGFNNGSGATAPTFWLITDTNTAPTTGNIEFRVINGSSNSPAGGFDAYIVPPGTNITGLTPQVSGLTLGQASGYTTLSFSGSGYDVVVTPHGNQNEYFDVVYQPPTGSIRTLIVVDNAGGAGISAFPLVLSDLN